MSARYLSARTIGHKTDAAGLVFGRLTVIGLHAAAQKRGRAWECQCACGGLVVAYSCDLNAGIVVSCGCYGLTKATKHGETRKTAEYLVWQAMKRRCLDKNNKSYPRYGGRGISVDPRWSDSYEAFLSDMGRRPSSAHQIDRIDNSLGYGPTNCRWSTPSENCRNTRRSRMVTLFGVSAPLVAWVEAFATSYGRVKQRLNSGRSPEQAFEVEGITVAWA